jgi:hypothetical protein
MSDFFHSGVLPGPTIILSQVLRFGAIPLTSFQIPVEESIDTIPKPLSVKESGSFLSGNSRDPGVGLNKFLSNIIQTKGTNQIMIIWKVFNRPVK